MVCVKCGVQRVTLTGGYLAGFALTTPQGRGPDAAGAPTLTGGEDGIRVYWYPLRTVSGRRSEGEVLPHRHAVGRVLERAGAGKHRGGERVGVKKGVLGGLKGASSTIWRTVTQVGTAC